MDQQEPSVKIFIKQPRKQDIHVVLPMVEEMHQNWEIARWMAWQQVLLSPDIKPAQKPHTPKAFMTFPWEKPDAGEIERMKEDSVVTESEAIELTKIFADYHLKNKENN